MQSLRARGLNVEPAPIDLNALGGYRETDKTRAFHTCDVRFRALQASNQCGKTTDGAVFCIRAATGRDPRFIPPVKIWASTEDFPTSLEGNQLLVHEWLPYGEVIPGTHFDPERGFKGKIVRFTNGSYIRFKSFDQGREGHQAGNIDILWFDEEPPKPVFGEGVLRIANRNGLMLLTFTALKGFTFLYTDYYEPWRLGNKPNWAFFGRNFYDNPTNTPDQADALFGELGEKERRIREHGDWLDVHEGRLIPVDPEEYTDLPAGLPMVSHIDPAFKGGEEHDYFAMATVAREDRNIYLVAYIREHLTPQQRIDRVFEHYKQYRPQVITIQDVPADMEFYWRLKEHQDEHGCVLPLQPVRAIGKVPRGLAFSPIVEQGRFKIRKEHTEYLSEHQTFATKGMPDDLIDAVMGATEAAFEYLKESVDLRPANRRATENIRAHLPDLLREEF